VAADVATWNEQFNARLNEEANDARYQAQLQLDGENVQLYLSRRRHGVTHEAVLGGEFFQSGDWRRITGLRTALRDHLTGPVTVARGERENRVRDFDEAYRWFLNEARRGLHVQRYKGLGEMNPGQLWETTLDPAVRRLVRVNIEDAVAADQIFTTLMGEQVEPRRDFIEQNALLVGNLDL